MAIYNLGNTTVLRLSLFGNIHASDNFDSGNNCRKQTNIIICLFIKGSVDAVTDTHLTLHRLNMNIGCSLAYRLINHILYKLNDRGVVDIFTIDIILLLKLTFLFSGIFLQCGIYLRLTVILIQRQHNTSGRCNYRFHLKIGDDCNIIHGSHIKRVCHRYPQNIRAFRRIIKGKNFVLLQDIGGNQVKHLF